MNDLCISLGFDPFLNVLLDEMQDFEQLPPPTAQLALVSLEIALAKLWLDWGLELDAVIGHSLGEYSALCVAGVLSICDTLLLVGQRAAAMQKYCSKGTHTMLAVRVPESSIEGYLGGTQFTSCTVSCRNSPSSTVVGGPTDEVLQLEALLTADGIKSTSINAPYAFHTSQMDAVLEKIREFSEGIQSHQPRIPIISSLRGRVLCDQGELDRDYLVQHTREKVNFAGALEAFQSNDLCSDSTLWVECGPGPGCLSFVQATIGSLEGRGLISLQDGMDCWKSLSETLASIYNSGIDVQWRDLHKHYEQSLRLLQLPTYAFDTKNYWLPFFSQKKQVREEPRPARKPLLSTCLHWVESEATDQDGTHLKFGSSPQHPELARALQGRVSKENAECASSV